MRGSFGRLLFEERRAIWVERRAWGRGLGKARVGPEGASKRRVWVGGGASAEACATLLFFLSGIVISFCSFPFSFLFFSALPQSFPPELRSLGTRVRVLDATGCGLRSLPPWLCEFTSLKRLVLADNPGLSLGDPASLLASLSRLSRLREVSLSNCGLTRVWLGRRGIEGWRSLAALDVSRNPIEEIYVEGEGKEEGKAKGEEKGGKARSVLPGALGGEACASTSPDRSGDVPPGPSPGPPSVAPVPASGTVSTPETVEGGNLPDGLAAPVLSSSSLPQPPSVSPPCLFPRLVSLDLSSTRLASLPPWFGDAFPALQELRLARTPLRALPQSCGGLAALTSLDLRGCPVATLPPGLFRDLSCLATLEIEGSNLGLRDLERRSDFSIYEARRRAKFDKALDAGVDFGGFRESRARDLKQKGQNSRVQMGR